MGFFSNRWKKVTKQSTSKTQTKSRGQLPVLDFAKTRGGTDVDRSTIAQRSIPNSLLNGSHHQLTAPNSSRMPSARQTAAYGVGGSSSLRKPLHSRTASFERPPQAGSYSSSTSTSQNGSAMPAATGASSNRYQPPQLRPGGASLRSRLQLCQEGEGDAPAADHTSSSRGGRRPAVPSLSFAKHEGLGFGSSGGIDECKSARLATLPSGGGGHSRNHSTHPMPRLTHQAPLTARQTVAAGEGAPRPGHNRVPSSILHCGPLTSAQVLRRYSEYLTNYEQSEILEYQHVYFIGKSANKIKGNPHSVHLNHSYDDERGDYHTVLHDHISYRYEVLSVLGKGSFGQVLKCYDYKTHTLQAVKIIRNKKRFHHQALVEVKVLEMLKQRDSDDGRNVVHLQEYFYFRSHLCIAFELMSINLYELIKQNNFQGLSLGLIRRFAVQILVSLKFLRSLRIIHCDLKPENILLKQPNRSAVKVIDFGSSCLEDERLYTYIQSRFYRAPEVILGLPYGTAIDMWSLGCILAELYTGYPIFPGENEQEQLLCIMEVLSVPPRSMLEGSSRSKLFFDSQGRPRIVASSRGKKRHPGTKDLAMKLRCKDRNFLSFLEGCFRWDPQQRTTPEEALQHPWITDHVPPATHRAHTSAYSHKYTPSEAAALSAAKFGWRGGNVDPSSIPTSRIPFRETGSQNLHGSSTSRTIAGHRRQHSVDHHTHDATSQVAPLESGFLPRLLSLKQQ
eukprot:evm.model.scf_1561.2 EVM.evm.TU.scf_1561.2   scf_1561:11317-16881(+)